ncbi:uncharacterized protein LOC131037370 isoform X2 [Cryptomeria japonica]|uniref:uncharacterized protein LOC131037370 isoform X2 n=1 Tax=Cryptomeria japonica TaxID=3369 RepID=UPI0025AC28E2|nr:uncharacterized protein LOC131037370 isoform X2 [Cryptomeria japonica]
MPAILCVSLVSSTSLSQLRCPTPLIHNTRLPTRRRILVCMPESFKGIAVSDRLTSGRRKAEQYDHPVENDGKIRGMEVPAHVDYISSVANPFVKHLVKLRRSSTYRRSVGSVVVLGTTPLREISEFLQAKEAKQVVDYLFIQDGADVPAGLVESSRRIVRVSPLVMQKLAGVETIEATEAIGVIKLPKSFWHMDSIAIQSSFQRWCSLPHRLLVLDGIQDGVFLLPGCCDPFNEKALRASQGACFQVPIATGLWNHLEILRDQYQMNLYAAQQLSHKTSEEIISRKNVPFENEKTPIIYSQNDLMFTESKDCNGNNPTLLSHELVSALADKPVCLVLGSEGKGLSEHTKKLCNLVAIPMPGGSESLNVSVAGGIFLFLLRR